ncbi:MAG TPA: response regulator transcription factor [Baekduia sp.]|uniref:winged helix-turn-helix domain-containing protein n=1 Tax=Baekduia sp. TaxID=2600305 RepID=UPI002BEB494D|nr:response regulator transcription factor [Baekduia sp.]HMJ35182.1 response regulator transcription factor [Baekduia sp.]
MQTVPVPTLARPAERLAASISELAAHTQRVGRADADPVVAAAIAAAGASLTAISARLAADLAQLAREPEQRAALGVDRSALTVGELHIDRSAQIARLAGAMLTLTPKEYALLSVLASEPDRLFTKAELYRVVWEANLLQVTTRTIDSHISRLRVKLGGAPWVETVWGTGYRLRPASPNLSEVAR